MNTFTSILPFAQYRHPANTIIANLRHDLNHVELTVQTSTIGTLLGSRSPEIVTHRVAKVLALRRINLAISGRR